MPPTIALSRKTKESGSTNHARGIGMLVLSIISLFSVYSIGVKHGMEQYTTTSVGLLTNQVGSAAEPTSQIFIPPFENHRQQTSPPHVLRNNLDIPEGEAKALPSIRVEASENDPKITGHIKYGGLGDKEHLGGFTLYDGQGVSPATWNHMMSHLGVHSVMDVGCGKGVSTLYFLEQGAEVLCVEGSHDAIQQTLLPNPSDQVIEHDFSRGPYWPGKTYDAVWCVEFLEHVGRNFQYNYIKAFRKAALIFVTHSRWGGWHHVEVHLDEWWINKFQLFGFQYSDALTKEIRQVALDEKRTSQADTSNPDNLGPDGEHWNAQHVWLTMMVFVNPAVASLPEHAHLLAEPGCYGGRDEKTEIAHKECLGGVVNGNDAESKLPDSYYSIKPTKAKQKAWFDKVKARIDAAKPQ